MAGNRSVPRLPGDDFVLGHTPGVRLRRPDSPDLETMEKLLAVPLQSRATPLIPDEAIRHLLTKAGMRTEDDRVVRMVTLAAQHKLTQLLRDAIDMQTLQDRGKSASKTGEGLTLTTQAVAASLLHEHNVRAGGVDAAFYVDSRTAGVEGMDGGADEEGEAGGAGGPV